MQKFWIVSLFHIQPSPELWAEIQDLATHTFESLGIEEFSMNEAEVDAILGDRSYSGGDLPQEVLDEVEKKVLGKPATYRFFFGEKNHAEDFTTQVKKLVLGEITIEECANEDWNAEWKKHYSPIMVNDQIEIIPSWLKPYTSKAKKIIYINPGMGFGTGSHETTFLCLKLFTDHLLNKKTNTILDFGSGSGILGLAALKFFPEAKTDFYDIDPEANKNCYQNAEINELQDLQFRLLLPEVRDRLLPAYDLLFANILEGILIREIDYLTTHVSKDGALVLSGLLRHQLDGIVSRYETQGMKLVKREEKGDWGALLFSVVN
jgi:ribosomal protein L11 methyltransferase